jgi:hypothetical protein
MGHCGEEIRPYFVRRWEDMTEVVLVSLEFDSSEFGVANLR